MSYKIIWFAGLEFNLARARRGERRFSYEINESNGTVLADVYLDGKYFEIEFLLPAHVATNRNLSVQEVEQQLIISFPK